VIGDAPGRMASNSGCTEVLVEGASTPNFARWPRESVIGIECHSLLRGGADDQPREYVQKLKHQIEQWNAQMAQWEAMSRSAQDRYMKQLEQFREKRDAAMAELRRLQSASADAWADMMKGTEAAFKSMQEAFENARKKFERK